MYKYTLYGIVLELGICDWLNVYNNNSVSVLCFFVNNIYINIYAVAVLCS